MTEQEYHGRHRLEDCNFTLRPLVRFVGSDGRNTWVRISAATPLGGARFEYFR